MAVTGLLPRNDVHKRSLALATPTLVAVIACALVGINVLILLAWWMMTRDRRRQRLRISPPTPMEHDAARRTLQMLAEAPRSTKRPLSRATYASVHSSLPGPAASYGKGEKQVVGKLAISVHKSKLRQQSLDALAALPKRELACPPAVLTRGVSNRKSIDAETASVYSCLSAPPEYHEKLFSTPLLSLDPSSPPSALRWIVPRSSTSENKETSSRHTSPIFNGSGTKHAYAFMTPHRHVDQSGFRSKPVNRPNLRLPLWSNRGLASPPKHILWRISDLDDDSSASATSSPISTDSHSSSSSPSTSPLPPVAPLHIRRTADYMDSDRRSA